MDQEQEVILNMLVTKYLDNKLFDHIYIWSETLASIAWAIISSYRITIMSTPGQAVFDRDVKSNLASIVDSEVVTAAKHLKYDIDNFQENNR